MMRIRRFEEKCAELYSAGKIRGFLHLYVGEEAIAVGVMPALDADDAVVSHYREHGHALARGVPAGAIMAEMFGKRRGLLPRARRLDAPLRRCRGASTAATRSSPAGCRSRSGSRSPTRCRSARRVTACFFGDGATAEGEFHESLNLAALWKLPVLFLCENNLYAMGTALARHQARDRTSRARRRAIAIPRGARRRHGRRRRRGGGAARRRRTCAKGTGPYFLELMTYRFRAHSMFDPELYRDRAEVERWKLRDPIKRFVLVGDRPRARSRRTTSRALERDVAREVEEAVAFAEAGTFEPVETLLRDVTTPREAVAMSATSRDPDRDERRRRRGSRCCAGDDAHDLSRRDPRRAARGAARGRSRVFLMGEDVGRYGGSYACSKGLLEEFGPRRGSATRRSRSRPSSAPGSARRSPGCDRSSRS